MKNILTTVIMGTLVIFFVACSGQSENKAPQEKMQMAGRKEMKMAEQTADKPYYYTCPMPEHKNIHSDAPGKCPECGMDLVAAVATTPDSADYYGCQMPEHSQIRSDKPGKCPECNMNLVPMRLEKKTNM